MKDNTDKTSLSLLALRITAKISVSANLCLPPEAAEVGHVILESSSRANQWIWGLTL